MSTHPDHLAIFITATDTGVGKTTITAALVLGLKKKGYQVGVMKPVETGIDPQQTETSDTVRLQSLLSPPPSFASICLYAFSQPVAPLTCARATGTTIDLARIATAFHLLRQQHTVCLVEGAGGLLTPLSPTRTIRDLIATLNLPALVVGRTSLGSVNHMLLTLEALKGAGIRPCGIVLNDPLSTTQTESVIQQRSSTIRLIQEWSEVPVFGPLEFQKSMHRDWRTGVENLADHPEIQRLVRHIIETEP
ncbi:dethiobiotin synthase [Candidatus Nitrospira neomarina]|uniref:ATP-dependent dethiobiotin synthetase BioD n=1 Tax=Candidatus Nitrospira neomarina TaxID=3020899 RepID=A0AA96GLX8_9BACT|nr:dethiobiotin synthase [Candidatus Nitrospira neomarina]WNM63727.1 dethiobiotin synthase [Candidatus Nitrospira neomarina]